MFNNFILLCSMLTCIALPSCKMGTTKLKIDFEPGQIAPDITFEHTDDEGIESLEATENKVPLVKEKEVV